MKRLISHTICTLSVFWITICLFSCEKTQSNYTDHTKKHVAEENTDVVQVEDITSGFAVFSKPLASVSLPQALLLLEGDVLTQDANKRLLTADIMRDIHTIKSHVTAERERFVRLLAATPKNRNLACSWISENGHSLTVTDVLQQQIRHLKKSLHISGDKTIKIRCVVIETDRDYSVRAWYPGLQEAECLSLYCNSFAYAVHVYCEVAE